jgi:hypothetical protein
MISAGGWGQTRTNNGTARPVEPRFPLCGIPAEKGETMRDVLVVWGQYVLLVMLFSSVVGSGKLLFGKSRVTSRALATALWVWLVLGATAFFVLFCKTKQGTWLWE